MLLHDICHGHCSCRHAVRVKKEKEKKSNIAAQQNQSDLWDAAEEMRKESYN